MRGEKGDKETGGRIFFKVSSCLPVWLSYRLIYPCVVDVYFVLHRHRLPRPH